MYYFRVIFYKLKDLLLLSMLLVAIYGFYLVYGKIQDSNNTPIVIEKCSDANQLKMDLVIDVEGAVNNPGVIKIANASYISDAIEKAGGFTEDADLKYVDKNINKASLLVNGQKIYIPSISETVVNEEVPADEALSSSSISDKININLASEDELDQLPGIGLTYAKRIIEGRPYNSIEEIKNVKGIGDNLYEKIKEYISI